MLTDIKKNYMKWECEDAEPYVWRRVAPPNRASQEISNKPQKRRRYAGNGKEIPQWSLSSRTPDEISPADNSQVVRYEPANMDEAPAAAEARALTDREDMAEH